MRTRIETGRMGEDIAVAYLEAQGFQVLDRNWYGPSGELDAVVYDPDHDAVVGVEVKTRRGRSHGTPAEAVTPQKVRRLRALLAQWLSGHQVHADEVRIDVVAVELDADGPARVEHLEGVC